MCCCWCYFSSRLLSSCCLMAIPLRLCWEQLDSVWMNWLLNSQLYPEMPVKTCPHCARLPAAILLPEAFSFCFTRRKPWPRVHTSLGGGGCSQVSALALHWSVSRRPGTRTGQLWITCQGYLLQQSVSQPHTYWRYKNIQQSPSLHESIGLLEADSCSPEIALLLISSLNSPGAARVMDAQPERCLIHMFFNNWMIKYSVIPGTAVPGL